MLARLTNWYRRHISRHSAAQDRRARAELARKARMAADDVQRAKCLQKFGLRPHVGA